MRRILTAAGLAAIAIPVLAGQAALDFKDANAREILRRGREAVGGVDAVAGLQSLVLTGISRIPANAGLVECDLEIRILLPDRYVRIDRARFGEKRSGFAGRSPLSVINELGKTTLPPESLAGQIVESERERMLQLLLGSAAYLAPSDVVSIRSVSGDIGSYQPQGTADAGQRAAAKRNGDGLTGGGGPDSGGGRTFFSGVPNPYVFQLSVRRGAEFRYSADPATFLPSRLSYVNGNGDDVTVAFGERRRTEGLNLPYRVTTTSRGKIIDDLLLYRIDINPPLTKASFER